MENSNERKLLIQKGIVPALKTENLNLSKIPQIHHDY